MKNRFGAAEWLLEAFSGWEALRRRRVSFGRAPRGPAVFCFGQSHALSLRRAWKWGLYRPEHPPLRFKFLLCDNKVFPVQSLVVRSPSTGADSIYPPLRDAFDKHEAFSGSTETWLVSVVRGNDYNVFGLFEPDPPFDFLHPGLPDLPVRADAQRLPYDAVRLRFRHAAQPARRFYECLPRQNIAGVFHVEAPPPIPSLDQCRKAADQRLMKNALGLPKDAQISSPEFRMKLWQCQSDVNREICRETNVIYVGPPQEALDPQGYLVPAAWHGATHASAWYGALALRKIGAMIASRSGHDSAVPAALGVSG